MAVEDIKPIEDVTKVEPDLVTIKHKGQEVQVPKFVQEAFNDKATAEIARKLEPLLQRVQALESEKEELVKSSMTEAQLRKYENEKEMTELKKAKEELESLRLQSRKEKIENSLHTELGKYNDIFNPTQVFNLLRSQYDLDLIVTDGNQMVVAKKGDIVIPLQDAVTQLREDPTNSNLFIDTLKSGNQTAKTGKTTSGTLTGKEALSMKGESFLKAVESGQMSHLFKK